MSNASATADDLAAYVYSIPPALLGCATCVVQVRATFNLLTRSQLAGVHHVRRPLPAEDATMVTPTGLGFKQSVFNCQAAPAPAAGRG